MTMKLLLQVLDREHIIADLEAQLAAAIRRAEPPLTMEQGVQVRTLSNQDPESAIHAC
jgi:hypothetical protein